MIIKLLSMYLLLSIMSCQQKLAKDNDKTSSNANPKDNTVVIDVAIDNNEHKAKANEVVEVVNEEMIVDVPMMDPPPPLFITDNKPESLFYADDDDMCGNGEQDIRSRKKLDCDGLLYGAVEYSCNDSDNYCAELVRINEHDGSKIFVANLNLDTSLSNKSIVGIDFDSSGQLEILYQGYNTNHLSLRQAYVDCHNATLSSDHEIYHSTGLSFLNPQAQGFSIDAQGLAFTTIIDDFNNDNSNDGTKLALAGVVYPEFLNNVSAQYPMALVDGPFPLPDILNAIEGNDQANYICSIDKNTRLTLCQSIISFNNFPLGFSYANTKEADQDYNTGLNYSIVRDSNNLSKPYIAITNVTTHTIVNLFPFAENDTSNTNLVAIAVNQSYEECDEDIDIIGAKCDKHCNIIEVNCHDDIDNDNNGFTDCEDKACTLSVNCR